MIFEDEFFDKLPADLTEATIEVCNKFFQFDSDVDPNNQSDYYYTYLDAVAAIEAFIVSNKIPYKYDLPLTGFNNEDIHINAIREFYRQIYSEAKEIVKTNVLEEARFRYKMKISNSFHYKLTDGDINQIQDLLNKLRDLIIGSDYLTDEHKERLLDRLEKIQKEVHKKNTNFDKIYGLFFEGAIVLEKYRKNAQPFMDLIKSIVKIVLASHGNAEELPSSTDFTMLK